MSPGLFSWAFAAGSVAALNPCGFAVLPAYLAYQLGRDGNTPWVPPSSGARLGGW